MSAQRAGVKAVSDSLTCAGAASGVAAAPPRLLAQCLLDFSGCPAPRRPAAHRRSVSSALPMLHRGRRHDACEDSIATSGRLAKTSSARLPLLPIRSGSATRVAFLCVETLQIFDASRALPRARHHALGPRPASPAAAGSPRFWNHQASMSALLSSESSLCWMTTPTDPAWAPFW